MRDDITSLPLTVLRVRLAVLAFALPICAPRAALAQPASPVEVHGQPLVLSYSHNYFDGQALRQVVLTARSARFATDTLGAWTPSGEGTTMDGFVLRHRSFSEVFVTLCPFAGPGPGETAETWQKYQKDVAVRLGLDTVLTVGGESGTPGGTPSFASWTTREALFVVPFPDRAERHVVASGGTRGIVVVLAGPAREVEAVEGDFRFLLARLERQ